MLTQTTHDLAEHHNPPSRQFEDFNTGFVVEMLADIYKHVPNVSELVFHGHELREQTTLRAVSGLKTAFSSFSINTNSHVIADQWMNIDLLTCTAEELTEIMRPYETGMFYIPSAGTSAENLGNLIIRQTSGLGSLFQPKTYKNFLNMDVFVAMSGRFYQMRKVQA